MPETETDRATEAALWTAIAERDETYFADPANNPMLHVYFNADDIIASFLAPVLEALRDDLHGYPLAMQPDAGRPAERAILMSDNPELDHIATLNWRLCIDAMIMGFRAHTEMASADIGVKPQDLYRLRKERDRGLALFAEFYPYLWD